MPKHRSTDRLFSATVGALAEAMESRLLMSSYAVGDEGELTSTLAPGNVGGPVVDAQGDVFGVTATGGDNNAGMIYELPFGNQTATAIASFNGTTQATPSNLVIDSLGNLYGVTVGNGTPNWGTVFELPVHSSTILTRASFDGTNGSDPSGRIAIDSQGNIFGTTAAGGAFSTGEVFEILANANSPTILYSFDAEYSVNGVYRDASGNLFGTTYDTDNSIHSRIFEYAPSAHAYSTLATFSSADGEMPVGSLVGDSQGNLYGSAQGGGANGDGTVYEYSASTQLVTTLHSFNGDDGQSPEGSLAIDSNGNLFGTTSIGGLAGDQAAGTAFEIAAGTGAFSVIGGIGSYDKFTAFSDSLYVNSQDNLFGATVEDDNSIQVFDLYPTTAAKIAVQTEPANITAGGNASLVVEVEDASGNRIVTALDDITVSINTGPAGASFTGTATVASIYGYAGFTGLNFTQAGDYTLTITDGAFAATTTRDFTVNPSTATQVAFVSQPTTGVAGTVIAPVVVVVEDAFGNVITTDTSNVTLSATPGLGIAGTTTVAAVAGVATFSDITVASDASLTLYAGDDGFTATSNVINIAPPALPGVVAGTVIQPLTLDLVAATKKPQRVTFSIISGPTGGKLLGRTVQMTRAASATFKGVMLHVAGQYTLQIAAADGSILTRTLLVDPKPAVRLTVVTQPIATTVGGAATASVEFTDAFRNIATATVGDVMITVAAANGRPVKTIATTTATITAGFATFTTPVIPAAGAYKLVVKFGRRQVATRVFKVM